MSKEYIPSYINVLGCNISIELVAPDEMAKSDGDVSGTYDNDQRLIRIRSDLSHDLMCRTLLHEITHALIRIPGSNELISSKQEELLCNLMENVLPLFRDDRLLNFLKGEEF